MRKLILILLLLASVTFGETPSDSIPEVNTTKYLHISTIPGNADIYVGNTVPDYGSKPDYTSPAFIAVEPGEDQVLVAIFKPEFVDTLIQVSLSAKDTSYLIVSLKQSYDSDQIDFQQKLVSKRAKRSVGKGLMIASVIPFAIAATSSALTLYEISKAEDAKKILKNSAIASGEKYEKAEKDFADRTSTAKTTRKAAIGTAIGGAALLATGFILSF